MMLITVRRQLPRLGHLLFVSRVGSWFENIACCEKYIVFDTSEYLVYSMISITVHVLYFDN